MVIREICGGLGNRGPWEFSTAGTGDKFRLSGERGDKNPPRTGWVRGGWRGFGGDGAGYQPAVARTETMEERMVFHVAGASSTALGNMQPSQQMCWMPRLAASLSQ